jgi:uncharacterized phage protein (TIGR02218 family)
MSRSVQADLQTHMNQAATTTCRLIKVFNRNVSPALVFGICSLDRDIEYDDGGGDGAVTYAAANGFDPTTIAADLGFSVANAEASALLAESVDGITEDMVRAGALDDAEWVCYVVNFNDLTTGRHLILDAGDIGQVRLKYDTLWMPELLSYVMRLKQPIGTVWSRTCRATYGEPTANNNRKGCGVDISALWTYGTVATVGAESDVLFTGDAAAALVRTSYPSKVQFLTGDNAGREFDVESVDALAFTLLEPTPYPIQIGDEYRHRRDCGKIYEDDCITINANGDNFKGEPLIPVGDGVAGQTPNTQIPGGPITDATPT